MARLTVGNSVVGGFSDLIDELTLDLPGLVVDRASPNRVIMSAGDFTLRIDGNGMAAAIVDGIPVATGGTIRDIRLSDGDDQLFRLSGLDWDFVALSTALVADAAGQPDAAEAFLLDQSFTYVGNNAADILLPGATTAGGLPITLAGNDKAVLGGGDDTFALGAGNDRAFGGAGNDTIHGEDGRDRLNGLAGDDVLIGDAGVDRLKGGDGADDLQGGDDSDTVKGGSGNDSLSGGAGDDTITGDSGDDVLIGGTGNDVLDGGDGADRFDFTDMGDATADMGDDILRDFTVGTDVLVVANAADWTITTTGAQTLILTHTGGETIKFRNVETDVLTISDLI
jgi:Ca2+-binding RTX toxin-like protein